MNAQNGKVSLQATDFVLTTVKRNVNWIKKIP